jgi:Tfp pilus assembly protein PilX
MKPASPHLFHRLGAALRRQEGVTMIILLGVMLVTSLLVVVAFTSANGEVHLTNTDRAQKKAYYAAEAGLEDYEYHLTQDGNYLTYCTTPTPENKALNQYYKEGTETPLTASELDSGEHSVELREVEETNAKGEKVKVKSEEKYALQLIPAESDEVEEGKGKGKDKKCNKNHLVETMIEEKGGAAGTFRIASTGFSGKEKRTLIATFRNANFVSYVWYTMYEVGDPVVDGSVPSGDPSTWWTECGRFYQEREILAGKHCQPLNNYFGEGESINGPLHVEDHALVCGKPTFGRTPIDRIEFGNGNKKEPGQEGYSQSCGGGSPTFKGTHILPEVVPPLQPPPGDEELVHVVEENYHFYGKTEIDLTGKTMTIVEHKGSHPTPKEEEEPENKKKEVIKAGVAYPLNGVIYVSEGNGSGGCPTYSPFGPVPGYNEGSECGDVYVHGNYEESLTIAAQNDVVINESITTPREPSASVEGTPTTNDLLGLIANNFVRIYHPLSGTRGKKYKECKVGSGPEATNAPEDLKEPVIYAAMLAVKHAIIVDNFDCGTPTLGHLNVYGALAGLFSNGLTGIINGTTLEHGYSYNAHYDNRLQVEEPPHFLNPIEAAWYIQRQTLASEP